MMHIHWKRADNMGAHIVGSEREWAGFDPADLVASDSGLLPTAKNVRPGLVFGRRYSLTARRKHLHNPKPLPAAIPQTVPYVGAGIRTQNSGCTHCVRRVTARLPIG